MSSPTTRMNMPPAVPSQRMGESPDTTSRVHLRSLLTGLAIMLTGSAYPLLFVGADGEADHGLAMALFWAMSAGLVRGVGFVPRFALWRYLFSSWACGSALLLAAWLRWWQ